MVLSQHEKVLLLRALAAEIAGEVRAIDTRLSLMTITELHNLCDRLAEKMQRLSDMAHELSGL